MDRFVATVNRFRLTELFFGPEQKIFGCELLSGLGCSVVDLPDHPIAVGVNIDAQLYALGSDSGLG